MQRAAIHAIGVLLLAAWASAPAARAAEPQPASVNAFAEKVTQLQSASGDELAKLKADLIAGGMAAHAALKEGPDATAAIRQELRKAIRAKRDSVARGKGLLVHEWGAIAYQQGFDEGRLDLREDTSDLPEFAQVWQKLAKEKPADNPDGPGINIAPGLPGGVRIDIIKKPIVYFYSDTPETVTFTVACPRGLLTTWWPKASKITPEPGTVDPKAALSAGSMLQWRNFDLQPGAPELPPVPDAAWWWPICRDTDSTPINVNGTIEKFIFYRGALADAAPALTVEGGAGQKYTLSNALKKEAIRHVLAVAVSGGKVSAHYIASIEPGQKISLDMTAIAKPSTPADLRERMADLLEEEGLFPKEAAGMSKIWRKEWFETDGVRIIYFNPRGATASLLPISIDPKPAQTVRTLLVAIQCIKESRENIVLKLIETLGDGSFAQREDAQKQLIQLGKLSEKPLREALKKAEDEEVRNRIHAILQKIDPVSKAADASDAPPPPGDDDLNK